MKKKQISVNDSISYIKKYRWDFAFTCSMLFLLLYRITLHADTFDEIINLNVAYRISQGDLPFYQCWEAFQNGDLLLSPLLFLYVKIIGSTSGIVLFSRFVFFLINCTAGIVAYFTFRQRLGKKTSFYLGFLFPFFQLYSLYYLWYDTSSTLLLGFGVMLAYRAFEIENIKKKYVLLTFAGVCHAVMSFAYPTLIIVAVAEFCIIGFVFVKKEKFAEGMKSLASFCLGAIIIIIIFISYVLFIIGFSNFIAGLEIILSYRSIGSGSSRSILMEVFKSFIIVNKFLILPSLICIFLYFKSFKNKRYLIALILTILLAPLINQFTLDPGYQGLANYCGYIALWGPFLYYIIEHKSKADGAMLLLIWVPSILSSVCISISTVYAIAGPIKCWQSFFFAFIVTIVFIIQILKSEIREQKFISIEVKLLKFISIIMLFNFFNYIYLKQPISHDDYRVGSGIYRGIKVNSSVASFEKMQQVLKQNIDDDCETILAGANLRPIYLMTKLRAFTPSVETSNYLLEGKLSWEMTFKYFDEFDDIPDMMVLQSNDLEEENIKILLEKYYTQTFVGVVDQIEFLIFKRDSVVY